MRGTTKHNLLTSIAKLLLFIISYAPLFGIMFLRHSHDAEKCVWAVLWWFSVTAIVAVKIGLQYINKRASNGYNVHIIRIDNRNDVALGYIAAYIVPFSSVKLSTMTDCICFIIPMLVVYWIYVRSNMIMINPILQLLRYSVYEIEYKEGDKQRNGLVLVKSHSIDEDKEIRIYPLGFKLFYGKPTD